MALLVLGFGLYACSGAGASDPFGSSGSGGGGGGGSASGTSYTVQSGGLSGYWHGITVVADVNSLITSGVGPLNPLTGLNSVQLIAKAPTLCLPPQPPSPTPCVPNYYQTSGSYRLATCGPSLANCPSVTTAWYTPRAGGKIQFDMKLELPQADVASVFVYFGNSGCAYGYRVSDADILLALAGFTRISIPLTSFTPPSGCTLHPDVTIFELAVTRIGIGTTNPEIVDVENVVFTN